MEKWNIIEAAWLLWIQENIRNEFLNPLMVFFSWLNNAGMLAIITVIVLLLLRKYRHVGITAFASLLVEFILLNGVLKNIVQRNRPYYVNNELVILGDLPSDFSFPSGHTGAAFAVAFVMLLVLPRKIGVSAVVVAALIAFSRIYNGVHYPTDVLGALAVAGLTAGMACKYVYPLTSKRLRKTGEVERE